MINTENSFPYFLCKKVNLHNRYETNLHQEKNKFNYLHSNLVLFSTFYLDMNKKKLKLGIDKLPTLPYNQGRKVKGGNHESYYY